jgi:hypothetical protein
MYVEGVGQKSGPCTATFNDLLCLRVSLSSSFMTVYVADAHAHVLRLVSVAKMVTVLEECNTEEQRSVVRL